MYTFASANGNKHCSSKAKALINKDTCPGGGMVDALVSGASAARRAGSSPVLGTQKRLNKV